MDRRDFLKCVGIGIACSPFANLLAAYAAKGEAAPKPQDKGQKSNNVRTGMWFYLGREKPLGFDFDFSVMGKKSIDMMHKFNVKRVYLAGIDALTKDEPPINDPEYNLKKAHQFMEKCIKAGIEPHVVGLEDHHFLQYSKSNIKRWFNKLIDNTKDYAKIYQVNIEPHAYDLDDKSGNNGYFRNNPKLRKKLLIRYLDYMNLLYDAADQKNVLLSPAVPMVDEPSIVSSMGMNYHTLLREEGLCPGGLNDVPAHYLHIMSYSLSPKHFKEMAINNIGDIKKPFALSSSNFPNAWDPYFESKEEFKNMDTILSELKDYNPNLKEHLLFCNLSIQDKITWIKYANPIEKKHGLPYDSITRDDLVRYWQGGKLNRKF